MRETLSARLCTLGPFASSRKPNLSSLLEPAAACRSKRMNCKTFWKSCPMWTSSLGPTTFTACPNFRTRPKRGTGSGGMGRSASRTRRRSPGWPAGDPQTQREGVCQRNLRLHQLLQLLHRPHTRGREHSRLPEMVIKEVRDLPRRRVLRKLRASGRTLMPTAGPGCRHHLRQAPARTAPDRRN